MNSSQKQKIAQAIAAFAQAVQRTPSIVNCSMCDGSGELNFEGVKITCPRCEGSGQCGHFAIVLEEENHG